MSAPQFVVRSFGGAAQPAQLVQEIGATDTSFGITNTTGWIETVGANIGQALGTSGPFLVILDRFSDTVEKVLCSGINLTTGIITVYTSGGYSGRGYDDTTAQGHTPNTVGGVQTGWSAAEAYEANLLVAQVLGGSPSTGQVLQWNGTESVWVTPSAGVTGLPAARIYLTSTTGTLVPSASPYQISPCSQDFVHGGVTFTGSNTLTVPTTGYYSIDAIASVVSTGQGQYDVLVYRNGSLWAGGIDTTPAVSGSSAAYGGTRFLDANDQLTFYVLVTGSSCTATGGGVGATCELSLSLTST